MKSTGAKEDISISYISALCAYSEISYDISRHDADSTDGVMRKTLTLDNGQRFTAELRIQLKCTSSPTQYKDNGDTITYRLKVKNYDDLRRRATSPIILGLLVLPESSDEWLSWTTDELLIKGCMYWANLSGAEASTSKSTVNITIEKKNVINENSLLEILEQIAREEW